MKTVKNEINIAGKSLMSGIDCKVNIFPSVEPGIKFYISGSKTPVFASHKNVVSTDNCVTLANDEGSKVVLVEHFMAACAFAGIDNLDVCLDGPELPVLDGSSLEWYNSFLGAGITSNDDFSQIPVKTPLAIADNKAGIALIPADELQITYCVDFNHPGLKNRYISFELTQDKKQILEARTFGYLKDLEKFQQAGMALGVTSENTVGLTDDGFTTGLRSEFEPIKHKILDLIGDLFLTGLNPLGFKAHIIAKAAGHKTHVQFARIIDNSRKLLNDNTNLTNIN